MPHAEGMSEFVRRDVFDVEAAGAAGRAGEEAETKTAFEAVSRSAFPTAWLSGGHC
jgi:hypothetical protein